MTDDATLSDFEGTTDQAGGADTTRDAADDRPECDDTADEPTADSSTTDAVDAARATYAWGEYTCADCETATERVWREGDSYVCPACKSW